MSLSSRELGRFSFLSSFKGVQLKRTGKARRSFFFIVRGTVFRFSLYSILPSAFILPAPSLFPPGPFSSRFQSRAPSGKKEVSVFSNFLRGHPGSHPPRPHRPQEQAPGEPGAHLGRGWYSQRPRSEWGRGGSLFPPPASRR